MTFDIYVRTQSAQSNVTGRMSTRQEMFGQNTTASLMINHWRTKCKENTAKTDNWQGESFLKLMANKLLLR